MLVLLYPRAKRGFMFHSFIVLNRTMSSRHPGRQEGVIPAMVLFKFQTISIGLTWVSTIVNKWTFFSVWRKYILLISKINFTVRFTWRNIEIILLCPYHCRYTLMSLKRWKCIGRWCLNFLTINPYDSHIDFWY